MVKVNYPKTVDIDTYIDLQGGFATLGLTKKQGGVLYVPDGEKVDEPAAELIASRRNSIIVLSQDFHPKNHISFMVNHPGVMEYRIEAFKEFLKANKQEVPTDAKELYERSQQIVHFFADGSVGFLPFQEIVVDIDGNIKGLKEGDRIKKVQLDTNYPTDKARGRVSKVLHGYEEASFEEMKEKFGYTTQTLWQTHCVQGTESSLFLPEISKQLPPEFVYQYTNDLQSKNISYFDEKTGNTYIVIRKGYNSERDSYGIGIENDKRTLTTAYEVYTEIADNLRRQGVKDVRINVGGLATNYCTEFSVNNIHDLITGIFRIRGINAEVRLVTDISKGIPNEGGKEVPFSLEGAPLRMQEYGLGTKLVTSRELLTENQPSQIADGRLTTQQRQVA